MLRLNARYLTASFALFCGLVGIAVFIRTGPIRTYFGDLAVVAFLYTALRGVTHVPISASVVGVVGFALLIEAAQGMQALDKLGLGENRLAQIVFGATFDWFDVLMYTLGGMLVLATEMALRWGKPPEA